MTDTAVDPVELSWDLSDLLGGDDEAAVDRFLDQARDSAAAISAGCRLRVHELDGPELVRVMQSMAEVQELLGRAQSYAYLRFAADTSDPANGARLQHVQERSTAIGTTLVFFDVEWAALPDERVAALLETPGLEFARHHLETARRYREHLLTEPEEKLLAEKQVTGAAAWGRLFGELLSSLDVAVGDETITLEEALSRLALPDRAVRKATAEGITAALAPGLRTRAFVYNTLLHDKAVDDRLRRYEHWLAERNLGNEASDESVEALVSAVQGRYDLPQRWYRLKARLLGLERLADYDRLAGVSDEDERIEWDEARGLVLDAYASFSPEMASIAEEFFDRRWIDVPVRPGKQPGAFCMYTVPSVHPYVLLNWTSRRSDVVTLAHELGHGLHAYLSRPQGVFHQGTPLTLAETASVFGETVTFGRLLERCETAESRLSLLAQHLEGGIATVFRQTAMNRFEHLAHTARRTEGELSVERLGELWAESQAELFGDAVELTEGYRTWWSYIPHFVNVPGYVYAYSYGQLLALAVYRQYEEQGSDFVPRYLHLLSSGGSMAPEELGRIVGCDLADPGFWDGGLAIIEQQLDAAETAAFEAGRL